MFKINGDYVSYMLENKNLKKEFNEMEIQDAFNVCANYFCVGTKAYEFESTSRVVMDMKVKMLIICYHCGYYIRYQHDENCWMIWSSPSNWLVCGETIDDTIDNGIKYVCQKITEGETKYFSVSPETIFNNSVKLLIEKFDLELGKPINYYSVVSDTIGMDRYDLQNDARVWSLCLDIIFNKCNLTIKNNIDGTKNVFDHKGTPHIKNIDGEMDNVLKKTIVYIAEHVDHFIESSS